MISSIQDLTFLGSKHGRDDALDAEYRIREIQDKDLLIRCSTFGCSRRNSLRVKDLDYKV